MGRRRRRIIEEPLEYTLAEAITMLLSISTVKDIRRSHAVTHSLQIAYEKIMIVNTTRWYVVWICVTPPCKLH